MDRLKKLRKDLRLSQAQLAEKAGVDQSFISRLEAGKTGVSVANLQAIAGALGVPMSAIVEPGSPENRLLQAIERIPPDWIDAAASMLETLADQASQPPKKPR